MLKIFQAPQVAQETFAALLLDRKCPIPADFFSGEPALISERIRIYRGNLHALWSSALRNAFPVIHELVGEEFFDQLSILYGQQFPSQSGDLNVFGQHFADFLQEEVSVQAYPYFSSVAALEWQQHCAYYAADADAFDLASFLSIAGQDATSYALICHPAFALFNANFAAVQICLAHQNEAKETISFALDISSYAVVSRKDWRVQLTQLSDAEFVSLRALRDGESLGVALESAMELDPEFEVASTLQQWFALGIFTGCRCKD
jgi:hypothetical protein